MRFSEYKNYFKAIADAHVDLKGFFRIISVDWPFRNHNLQEYFNNVRASSFQYPVMGLETYITKAKDARGDQIDRLYDGAFLIIDSAKVNDFADEDSKYDKCEQISDEVIAYVMKEFEEHWDSDEHPKRFLEPNSFSGEFIGFPAGNLVGIRVMFNFMKNVSPYYTYDESKFNWE